MTTYIADCPYCEWATDPQATAQYAKHHRAQHIFDEHDAERSITWHQDTEPVREVADD